MVFEEKSFAGNVAYLDQRLKVNENFDMLSRELVIGGRRSRFYQIDGFCKDDMMQKMLQFFIGITDKQMPDSADSFLLLQMPHVEAQTTDAVEKAVQSCLSGEFLLVIDGYEQIIIIDARTYPARTVTEPDKDKVMRGSKDGFVETIVANTALIRRRIRSEELRMEMIQLGETSHTDIVLCYMEGRVNQNLLQMIRHKIQTTMVDALTMNQESLAECLYPGKWFNPFPKFRYTERPDTATAQILEGNLIILVDNSPQAMMLPVSLLDLLEEADDFYFPPVTGTYLKISRFLIALITYFLTPTFLLFMQNPQWIPEMFQFVMLKETSNLPLIWQFLILELAVDGLKLAAINTPGMLSTPLSVLAAIVLGELSVSSGWFNGEVMLYMAFVAVANYTQASYELGYAIKFLRIIQLVLTALFNVYGYVLGIIFTICCLVFNKTIAGTSFTEPLIPFRPKKLFRRLIRKRIYFANTDGANTREG